MQLILASFHTFAIPFMLNSIKATTNPHSGPLQEIKKRGILAVNFSMEHDYENPVKISKNKTW